MDALRICVVTLLFTVVVDVVTDFVIIELLYTDDLVLIIETDEVLRNKFLKWKESFDGKDLKVIIGKTKVVVCGGITKYGMYIREVKVKCGVFSFSSFSVLCVQSGKWIHCRCAIVKRVTTVFKTFYMQKM